MKVSASNHFLNIRFIVLLGLVVGLGKIEMCVIANNRLQRASAAISWRWRRMPFLIASSGTPRGVNGGSVRRKMMNERACSYES